jgi:hypothetical protein
MALRFIQATQRRNLQASALPSGRRRALFGNVSLGLVELFSEINPQSKNILGGATITATSDDPS